MVLWILFTVCSNFYSCCFCYLFLALPELTRKQVADMFYNAELEYKIREPTKPHRMKWSFKTDAQRDEYIKEITDEAASSVYHHQQADKCTAKGT